MHLDEAESELLKKWTVKKLEDISDADSDVLADYVLALAKADDPEPVAKANCIENLKDFLLDNTEPFVDSLFQAITTKSFDPDRPPPKPTAPIYQPPKRPTYEGQSLPNESRKRSYYDWDGEDQAYPNGHMQSTQGADRPSKQQRRGGRGLEARGGSQLRAPPNQHMPPFPTPPPGMPQIDPNNPMAALLAMQQAIGLFAGMANGGSPPNPNLFVPPQSGQRCRDYDTKGFCAAGASCPYEHGDDPYVIPGQEYDPNNATLLNVTPSRVGHVNTSPNTRGRGSATARARGAATFRGGGKRSDFSHIGPNRDTSITSIVVEQIPNGKCDNQSVREFFSEFGNIEEIFLQAEKRLAIIKFSSYDAARAAYESPKVVFDNRFVKVYWYKPEKMLSVASQLPSHPVPTETATDNAEDVQMHNTDHIDTEEFAKRQEAAQRKHEEAKKRREEAAKQKLDLDAKLKATEAERRKMADLIAKKSGKPADPGSGTEDSEHSKALKAQLAKLEAEARTLGIDPDATTDGYNNPPSFRGRGGYRGRPGGRGYMPGYRGSWAGGAVKRLDNRPKTVAVTFAEGSYENHDEALRQFLLFNSLDSATSTKHPERDDTALVTFGQRYEGENFMAAAAGSDLLHIGKVNLAWCSPTTSVTNGNHDDDVKVENHDDDVNIKTDETSEQQSSTARDAVAYDVADDEDLDRWQ